MAHMQKIDQLKKRTTIYSIIEGLIILFIKLQLFNQMYQAFKLWYTLIFNPQL